MFKCALCFLCVFYAFFECYSTALTSVLIDDVDQNENSFRSDTELPVVEPEHIEIDGEIFVNNADFCEVLLIFLLI
jgi:hypothetical protein